MSSSADGNRQRTALRAAISVPICSRVEASASGSCVAASCSLRSKHKISKLHKSGFPLIATRTARTGRWPILSPARGAQNNETAHQDGTAQKLEGHGTNSPQAPERDRSAPWRSSWTTAGTANTRCCQQTQWRTRGRGAPPRTDAKTSFQSTTDRGHEEVLPNEHVRRCEPLRVRAPAAGLEPRLQTTQFRQVLAAGPSKPSACAVAVTSERALTRAPMIS